MTQHLPIIQLIMNLKEKHSRIWTELLDQNKIFYKPLLKAFEKIINKDNVISHALCLYCNQIMTVKSSINSEKELLDSIEKIIFFFNFLRDKDIFQQNYCYQLSKRLLNETSYNLEYERIIISKMKVICSPTYTTKMELLLQDYTLSREESKIFSDANEGKFPFQFEVQLLQKSLWNYCRGFDIMVLPPKIYTVLLAFNTHYIYKYQKSRVLVWDLEKSFLVLIAELGTSRKKYELITNTLQGGVLLLFNDYDSLQINEIEAWTQIPIEKLQQVMNSLKKSKIVLEKCLEGVPPTYSINPTFQHRLTKLRLINLWKERPEVKAEESKENELFLLKQRGVKIEATIIKIMKARRSINHNTLIEEVIKKLKNDFVPAVEDIKIKIELLIELEYIEPSEHDAQLYNYKM